MELMGLILFESEIARMKSNRKNDLIIGYGHLNGGRLA